MEDRAKKASEWKLGGASLGLTILVRERVAESAKK
jgi:hypothetical protein